MTEKQYTGHIQKFVPSVSDWSINKKWLHNCFTANAITDNDRQSEILLSFLYEKAYKLLHNMCIPDEPESKSHTNIIKLLDGHFKTATSVFSCREIFLEARKMANDSPKLDYAV